MNVGMNSLRYKILLAPDFLFIGSKKMWNDFKVQYKNYRGRRDNKTCHCDHYMIDNRLFVDLLFLRVV
uniref:Uncharacterized protein n=1 Tax=Medicago truncatula TaxID=3880 RepID=I3SXK1_MEDTR|nr:unknown [Medicago truncatula]